MEEEKSFELEIVTPEKMAYSGKVRSLIAPGEIGSLGVLVNHAPLITNLIPGKIIINDIENRLHKFNSPDKGFLQILNNKATLLLNRINEQP